MKLKYPKTIRIGSLDYKITYNKKLYGASALFNGKKSYIKIGTKGGLLVTFENIIHELKELIQAEQSTEFEAIGTAKKLFAYDHGQHTDLCSRLAGLLEYFIE